MTLPSPEFLTLGQNYSVAIGTTLVLPCSINESEQMQRSAVINMKFNRVQRDKSFDALCYTPDRQMLFDINICRNEYLHYAPPTEQVAGHYVLAWKKDIAVLTAGSVKVTMNPRIRLISPQHYNANKEPAGGNGNVVVINGGGVATTQIASPHSSSYNLEIQNVYTNDAGEYACQIGTIIPKEIVHSLEVLVPPKIDSLLPRMTNMELFKGSALRLVCTASGKPTPTITWSRKNNVMPNGEPNITRDVLEILHADRHTVGHYRCTATNGVEQSDTRDIFVNVLYAPEIEVEHPIVHTGVGYETQLICTVHAEPSPQIVWYKDSTQLGITEQHSQQSRGNRHTLIIRNVTLSDMGNYTCQASNHFGKDRAMLTLFGIPSQCEFFDSPAISENKDYYNVSWMVQSFEPVLEYKLYYRTQTNDSNAKRMMFEKKPNDHWNSLSKSLHHYYGKQVAGPNKLIAADWKEITIVPVNVIANNTYLDSLEDPFKYHQHAQNSIEPNERHHQSFVIGKLRSSSNYEIRVQARNVHGWNKMSKVLNFSTHVDDDEIVNIGADYRPLTQQSSCICSSDTHSIKMLSAFSLLLTSASRTT